MKDLNLLTDDELKQLICDATAVLESRKDGKKFILETYGEFDPRKHGHAYLAKLNFKDGKIEREFIGCNGKQWDGKHKLYSASWTFVAKEGDKFEGRLSDGSWKNDSKDYYIVMRNDTGELMLKSARSLSALKEL